MTVHPAANEAALRYMAAEIQRLQLMLAQAVGNLALANQRIGELQPPEEVEHDSD